MTIRAAVVGSGPNGLTAACVLARQGWEVTVYESAPAPGGALRSADLFGEGVPSDLGASVHPFGAASPAFAALELTGRGLEWAHPQIPAAHGADDGAPPVLLRPSLKETAAGLGRDAGTWRWLVGPLAEHWEEVSRAALSPPTRPFELLTGHPAQIGRPAQVGRPAQHTEGEGTGRLDALLRAVPSSELGGREAVGRLAGFARLGLRGGWSAAALMRLFREERSRALFSGLAAHATVPLNHPMTGAFGLVFAAAGHTTGWPVARGGSQTIVDALVSDLRAHGGRIETGFHVQGLRDVPLGPGRRGVRKDLKRRGWRIEGRVSATGSGSGQGSAPGQGAGGTAAGSAVPLSPLARGRMGASGSSRRRSAQEVADVVLLDLTPKQVMALDGLQLPGRYARRLRRWDYGPAVVKVDFLLEGPIPWRHQEMGEAGTVHLGGPQGQILASESAVSRGVLPGRPYVLLTQPAAADASRAREGRTACWAYAHVPQGLSGEGVHRAAQLIEAEIEAQAPGFGAVVRARTVWGPEDLESWNPNLVGGSISGGVPTVAQFLARPAASFTPYTTGADGVFLCSSSTPPGSGAHGMSGFHAARAALRDYT